MIIKGVAKLKKIMYPKGVKETRGDFTIASFEPVEVKEGTLETHKEYKTFSIKGVMPPLKEGQEYAFIIEESEKHPVFGVSYEPVFMKQNITIDENDVKSVRTFLKVILTETQLKNMYDTFEKPLEVIKSGDIEHITTVTGIGIKTAERILDHYESQKDYSHAYVELGKYDIKPQTIRKIVNHYKSPELAVQKILTNPYILTEIDGYGFKTCDALYIKLGLDINAPIRIKAFLTHLLKEQAQEGHTWTHPVDILKACFKYIPNADKKLVGTILLESPEFYLSEDKMKISLSKYQEIESELTKEICRVLTAENNFNYDGWEDDVKKVEDKQGFSYTGQQKGAMQTMFENNITLVEGLAGSGKSTSLKAVVDILESHGYTYAQSALSGKASNNLAIITGADGYTMHRLLCYNPITRGFTYDSKNPLPYDILIIDEISMVDAELLLSFMKAVRSGAKLIMLGDSQQLESIGIPAMMPLINSGVIPRVMLTEIHRQAQKSAIVTHSIAIRNGKMPISSKLGLGRHVFGELEDLEYEIVDDESEKDIRMHVLRQFKKSLDTHNINDIQILSATRNKGELSCLSFNRDCQKMYNPASPNKDEVMVGKLEKDGYILRVGDKVMNVKNNYSSVDEYNNPSPVFNGNIGILQEFGKDDENGKYMIVDFEGIGRIKIDEKSYSTIELAYSITVHKAQGMGVPIVIVAFPFHFMLNSRQFLYTAITRAKEFCLIATSYKTLRSAIRKDSSSSKRTYLAGYLNSYVETIKTKVLQNKL